MDGTLLNGLTEQIPLTQGKFAIVDDKDYEWLNQWKWCAAKKRGGFYATRTEDSKTIYMHREILGLTQGDGKETDHNNHNGLDNRRLNIRICTPIQNQQNQQKRTGRSKYKGVSWHKASQKWTARIAHNNKFIHLGYFDNQIDAAEEYNKKAAELFGEFAYLNVLSKTG